MITNGLCHLRHTLVLTLLHTCFEKFTNNANFTLVFFITNLQLSALVLIK